MKPPAGALLALAAVLLLPACSSEEPGTVVARVGDSKLTLEEAAAAVDTASSGGGDRLSRYVTAWVNEELLFQEARRLGIADDAAFRSRLGALERRLAGQELLDRLVWGDTAAAPDSALRAYFAAHPDEFTLAEDHLKLRLATFRGRETARKFASAVNAGLTWEGRIDSMAADPKSSAEILSATQETWYTRSTIYPPELWKVAGPLNPGEVSFPLRAGDGFTVVQFLARAAQGKTDEFDVVRDDVMDRVLIEARRAKLEALLGTLRERYGVETTIRDAPRPGGAPADDANHDNPGTTNDPANASRPADPD